MKIYNVVFFNQEDVDAFVNVYSEKISNFQSNRVNAFDSNNHTMCMCIVVNFQTQYLTPHDWEMIENKFGALLINEILYNEEK